MGFDAVIFDCDGVLVDSVPATLNILRDMLADIGWPLSVEQCQTLFVGTSTTHSLDLIKEHVGKKLEQDWIDEFLLRRHQAMRQKTVAIPGIHDCLTQLQSCWPQQLACASAAQLDDIRLMLGLARLDHFFNDQLYSGMDVSYNKPYPDVYQAAAAGLGAAPSACAVIEDSVIGVQAGVSAGATVFAYHTGQRGDALREAGAHLVFSDMHALPELLTQHCNA